MGLAGHGKALRRPALTCPARAVPSPRLVLLGTQAPGPWL